MATTSDPKMDALFAAWRAARPRYRRFSNDGILNQRVWKTQSPKIAFLLKESTDGVNEIRDRRFEPGPTANRRLFWHNLNIWSYTLRQVFNGQTVSFAEAYSHHEDNLNQVALVNVKKAGSNGRVSSEPILHAHVARDWAFLELQLSLIDPNILFCCGTFRYISKHLSAEPLGHGVYKARGKTVVDFYHPLWQGSYLLHFHKLHDMLVPPKTKPTLASRSNTPLYLKVGAPFKEALQQRFDYL